MITNASDPPPDRNPPSDRSAYEYCLDCSFQALYPLNIDVLIQMLVKGKDYLGFSDKIDLLSNESQTLLTSSEFWDPLAKKAIIGIKVCITGKKNELSKMKKQLVAIERITIKDFASTHAGRISSDEFVASGCRALLNVLASSFMSHLKHDMCQGISICSWMYRI